MITDNAGRRSALQGQDHEIFVINALGLQSLIVVKTEATVVSRIAHDDAPAGIQLTQRVEAAMNEC